MKLEGLGGEPHQGRDRLRKAGFLALAGHCWCPAPSSQQAAEITVGSGLASRFVS